MPKSFVTLINEIEQELQDTGNAIWSAAELAIQLEDAIREASEETVRRSDDRYEVRHSFDIESRTGQASSTTSDALVDATLSQFASTDVDKVIYNPTDRTWAIVTAFISTSQLTLSRDIMASGEDYRMYNKGCISNKQVNLEDVTDGIGDDHGVYKVEFPVQENPQSFRNYKVEGNILTIDINFEPDDSADSDARKEVFIWFTKRHRVSQLTDLVGATTAIIAEGATSVPLDALSGTEIIAEDTELVIAGVRGKYRVTADVTLSSGSGTVVVWPPLESAAAEDDVITITGSTLTRRLERIVVELTAARAAISQALTFANTVPVGGPNVAARYQSWGGSKLAVVQRKMRGGLKPWTKREYPKSR